MSEHLRGTGVEVGPGHAPFPVAAGVSVRYVDRLISVEHHELFPELPPGSSFVEPDILADVNTDRLGAIDSASQDFVVASHVVEHLADPLGFLDDAHRVLQVGGVLLLLLPDRRHTFDRGREPSPLACLVSDYEAAAMVPDDEHLLEFLLGADQGPDFVLPDDPEERDRLFAWHRDRSIHVHCWTDDEFVDVLCYSSEVLGHEWELRDRLTTAQSGMEFGYVLERSRSHRPRRLARQLGARRRWRKP